MQSRCAEFSDLGEDLETLVEGLDPTRHRSVRPPVRSGLKLKISGGNIRYGLFATWVEYQGKVRILLRNCDNVAWMKCNGIRESSAPIFPDSVALHPGYGLTGFGQSWDFLQNFEVTPKGLDSDNGGQRCSLGTQNSRT